MLISDELKIQYDIYTASISNTAVTLGKKFTLSTTVTLKNSSNTQVDITSYARQGIFYSSGNLYFPLYTTTAVDVADPVSLIAIYPLTSSTASGTTLTSSPTTSIRMSSPTASPVCFEVEGICNYNNSMYFVANCANDTTYRLDIIGTVNDFLFN